MPQKIFKYLIDKAADRLLEIIFGGLLAGTLTFNADMIMLANAVIGGVTVFLLFVLWDERKRICRFVSPLRKLTDDIEKLSDIELNREGPLGIQRNTEYIAIAESIIEKLKTICDIQEPGHSGQYPDFFRGISHFVEKGDKSGVEKASRNIHSYYP